MTENKKATSNTIFVFVFIVLLVGAFFAYNKFSKKTFNLFDAVPSTTSFIVEFSSMNNLYEKIRSNKMWAELKKLPAIKVIDNHIHMYDSLAYNHSKIADYLRKGKGIFSHHIINGQGENLLILETAHQFSYSSVDALMTDIYGQDYTRIQSNYEGESIKKLIFNAYDNTFSYAVVGNILLGSISEQLVKDAIKHLKTKKSLRIHPDIKSLLQSAGKNVDANIYINSNQFAGFLELLTANTNKQFSTEISNYFSWMGLDVMLKDNELLLHGYTKAADSSNHFMANYYKQQPQQISLTGILPYNTSLMVHYTFENYVSYFKDYKQQLEAYGKLSEFQKKLNRLNSVTNKNIEQFIIPQIGTEAALISYASNVSNFNSKSFAIIKAKDIQEYKRRWGLIQLKVSGSGLVKRYKGFEIYRVNAKGITEVLLGSSFKEIKKFNYFFLNGFMIIANSASSLESYIDLYQSGKTLDLNDNYKSFIDNINERSNFYLYCNIRNGFDLLKKYISADLFNQLNSKEINFTNFHAAGIQITNTGDNLFTNIYLKYNDEIVEENRSVWKASLDAGIKGSPFAVKNHRNNTYNIVSFDRNNNMYLFDTDGNRLWKKSISEDIQSPVYVVDYYKNGKYQYLFNTKNYIHLIDLLGRNVVGYPCKLRSSATNAMAVFDYEKKKNYRIVLAGSDKKIYNYNIKGNEVNGWTKSQTLNIVSEKIQHLRVKKKDYILTSDNAGRVKIINRLGKERIQLKRQFAKAPQSDFYVNQTNKKGLFITTNRKGVLTYIASSGAIAETVFGNFTENHYFLYEDYNKDGHKDFIYLDGNKLRVYDRFKKPIFTYNFKSTINQKPSFYNLSGSESLLGIVSHKTQEIFLFNKRGEVIISKGLIGETPFIIQRIKNNRELNLIVGSGSSLYNYVIK
jgi:hypothetical protein